MLKKFNSYPDRRYITSICFLGFGSLALGGCSAEPYEPVSSPELNAEGRVEVRISNGTIDQSLQMSCVGKNLVLDSQAPSDRNELQTGFDIDNHPGCVDDKTFTLEDWWQNEDSLRTIVIEKF